MFFMCFYTFHESVLPIPDGIYGGRVLDHPGSFLAITNHGGLLAGLVRLGAEPEDEYFLQPVRSNGSDYYHVMYSSASIKDSKYEKSENRPHSQLLGK